jgi:ribosomal protein L15
MGDSAFAARSSSSGVMPGMRGGSVSVGHASGSGHTAGTGHGDAVARDA